MLAASVYMIVFRIVHIAAGVAWGGSVFLFVVFVQPSAAAVGPASGPFMDELLEKRRLVDWILRLAGFTIAGGLFLYWHDWQAAGSLGDWVGTRFGLALTIGSVLAIAGFLIGVFGTKPGVDELLALGRKAKESGGAPPPELAAQIQQLRLRLRLLARTNLAFITLAVLAMATARYW